MNARAAAPALCGKDEIRVAMRARRRAIPAAEKTAMDADVCARLSGRRWRGPVAVYLASPCEIDLRIFIEALLCRGTVLAAPRWNGGVYELARLRGLNDASLRVGPMGIREPAAAEIVPAQDISAWIVPGLAFTADGRRVGYGGGWYDRLLAGAALGAEKIGVAYPFQLVDNLPASPHDIRLSEVVCAATVESLHNDEKSA